MIIMMMIPSLTVTQHLSHSSGCFSNSISIEQKEFPIRKWWVSSIAAFSTKKLKVNIVNLGTAAHTAFLSKAKELFLAKKSAEIKKHQMQGKECYGTAATKWMPFTTNLQKLKSQKIKQFFNSLINNKVDENFLIYLLWFQKIFAFRNRKIEFM